MADETLFSLSDPDFVALLVRRAWCMANGHQPPPLPGQRFDLGNLPAECKWEDLPPFPLMSEGPPQWVVDRQNQKAGPAEKHPFNTTPVGGTFRVAPGPDQPKWNSFRIYCCTRGKKLGRKFRARELPDGSFEVYREA